MLKLIVTIHRKPGMTIEEFNDRWLKGHGPLVKKHAKTLRMRRYVQSQYRPCPPMEPHWKARGWIEPCDALTEVWWDSMKDIEEAFATEEGKAAADELGLDEAVFCDMGRLSAFLSEEFVIFDDT